MASDSGEIIDEFDGPPGEESVIRLDTTGDVLRELGKVYRAMRKKRVSVADGNGLTQTLLGISKVMRERDEDKALRKLEQLERKRGSPAQLPEAH